MFFVGMHGVAVVSYCEQYGHKYRIYFTVFNVSAKS